MAILKTNILDLKTVFNDEQNDGLFFSIRTSILLMSRVTSDLFTLDIVFKMATALADFPLATSHLGDSGKMLKMHSVD